MDRRDNNPGQTAAYTSNDEEYYNEDDIFGTVTAVGPDEDVEEYEATQQLLESHAASSSAAAGAAAAVAADNAFIMDDEDDDDENKHHVQAAKATASLENIGSRDDSVSDDGDDDDCDKKPHAHAEINLPGVDGDSQQKIYDSIKAAAPTIGKDEWQCPNCTFINDNPDSLVCSVCNAERIERNEPAGPPLSGMLEGDDDGTGIEIRPKLANGDGFWISFAKDHHICYGWGMGKPNVCYVRYVGREHEESIEMEWRKTQRRGRSREAKAKQAVGKGCDREKTVSELQAEEHFRPKTQSKKRPNSNLSFLAAPKSTARRKRKNHSAGGSCVSPESDAVGVASSSATPFHAAPEQEKGPGYLEKRLGMSMEELDNAMPKALRDSIHDCVWVPWRARDGEKVYHPALILRPTDISGKTEALELVGNMIEKAIITKTTECWNRHLVFWYSSGFSWAKRGAAGSYKAFTLEAPGSLVPYSVGVERGYNQPVELMRKTNSPNLISWRESCFLDGLKQVEKDAKIDKNLRGGPFFFEHQRELLRMEAKRLSAERELRVDMEREEKAAKREKRRITDREAGKDIVNDRSAGLCSLELCSVSCSLMLCLILHSRLNFALIFIFSVILFLSLSLSISQGEAKMTKGFRKAGFRDTVTLDNDKKRESVSNLSLQQLEYMMGMRNGDERWLDHPTNRRFHTIWAGPCCTTYSIAQSTKIYRTEGEFPHEFCQLNRPFIDHSILSTKSGHVFPSFPLI